MGTLTFSILNFFLLFITVYTQKPEFISKIKNVTVVEGQDATINCPIQYLGRFRVAWVKVESKTVLTMHTEMITQDNRFRISHTNKENWFLHIRNVNSADRGLYMCQINTIPMIVQTGYLQVHVPPDFVEEETSSNIVAKENQSIELKCKATGFPTPKISWYREDGKPIIVNNKSEMIVNGNKLIIKEALREHSGAYHCMASNDVPPSVSRRIALLIQFPPKITVPSELIGAAKNTDVILRCLVEAAPTPLTSWKQQDNALILSTNKMSIAVIENSYKFEMRLKINNLTKEDYGTYTCNAGNILGVSQGSIKLFETYAPKKQIWNHSPMSQQSKDEMSDSTTGADKSTDVDSSFVKQNIDSGSASKESKSLLLLLGAFLLSSLNRRIIY